jgi:hypothetical protein
MTDLGVAPRETALHLQELAQLLRDNAEALLAVMREQFGEQDTRTSRAGEICDAVQRLTWDLERRPDDQSIAATG